MSPAERAFDLTLALSAWSWAVLGLAHAAPEDQLSVVRLCIAALHLLVGLLVLRRRPLGRLGSVAQLAAALPALVVSGLALKLAHAPHLWPVWAQAVFLVGTALTMASLVRLGRDFSILPALREIRSDGPYRLVRHPAYLGELLMVLGCALASPPLQAWPVLLALPMVMLRVGAEERLLATSLAWCSYRERVRWRLLPGLW
jgi:protein-S-isoprenylcysteine O-methyltransferase Ste14